MQMKKYLEGLLWNHFWELKQSDQALSAFNIIPTYYTTMPNLIIHHTELNIIKSLWKAPIYPYVILIYFTCKKTRKLARHANWKSYFGIPWKIKQHFTKTLGISDEKFNHKPNNFIPMFATCSVYFATLKPNVLFLLLHCSLDQKISLWL